MEKKGERPQIYSYRDHLKYLHDITQYLLVNSKLTLRAIAKKSGINTNGYIAMLLSQERLLTLDMARKLAKGLSLDSQETKFFLLLVELSLVVDSQKKSRLIEKILNLSKFAEIKLIEDRNYYSDWSIQVIFELLHLNSVKTKEDLFERLKGIATKERVEQSLQYLKKKNYVSEVDGELSIPKGVIFASYNDKTRIIEIQQNHLFFLEMAKHRIIDDLDKREFQGLTIPLSEEHFVTIKKHLRDILIQIRDENSVIENADSIYRIQLSAFKVC